MKTTVKEITPQWAKTILETRNPRNRPISEAHVEKLARDISIGAFQPTHQGIAFYSNGDLADGQHRLMAVVKSAKAVQMMVTSGLPETFGTNGSKMSTFELIDNGRARGVGQMLQMAGYKNGNKIAAAIRAMVTAAAGQSRPVRLSTAQSHRAILLCDKSLLTCVAVSCSAKIVRPPAYVVAACSFYHTIRPVEAEKFLAEVGDVSGESKSPSRSLATWVNNHDLTGGCVMVSFMKVAASAIWHSDKGNSISKLYSNDEAFNWLLSLNPGLVKKLSSIANP